MYNAAPWYCDGCGQLNGNIRYQCQQCRGFNTYDLCDQCIYRASAIHPNHSFQLVQQPEYIMPMTNWTSSYPATYWPYTTQARPKVKVTYEYST
jgi:hypothetical protein